MRNCFCKSTSVCFSKCCNCTTMQLPKCKRLNSICTHARGYFREYCNTTSLHGCRYIGEKERTIFERVWWLFVFVICLVACVLAIHQVYLRWERNAVIIALANKETSIAQIPFPAVTICPQSKFIPEKLRNLSCENSFINELCQNRFHLKDRCSTRRVEAVDPIYHMKPEFTIYTPGGRGLENAINRFRQVLTDEGVCYSYNSLPGGIIFRENVLSFHKSYLLFGEEWSIEGGYKESVWAVSAYPERALGLDFNLQILASDEDVVGICKDSVLGYKVLLHAPMNVPSLKNNYFMLPLNQSVSVAVKPVMITTSNSLRKYSSETRGCYFQEERHLKYFKIYTLNNCKLECLANHTLKTCQCVQFFMPRENGTQICDYDRESSCLKWSQSYFLNKSLRTEIAKTNKLLKAYTLECNCLPSCTDLSYEVELSQSSLDLRNYPDYEKLSEDLNKSHFSSLKVHFKSDTFIKSERNELYGPVDFLANFGGLLGLFTGFSIISLMEILYFLTIRIFCNRRLYNDWAGKLP